jgi:hypothetical protein
MAADEHPALVQVHQRARPACLAQHVNLMAGIFTVAILLYHEKVQLPVVVREGISLIVYLAPSNKDSRLFQRLRLLDLMLKLLDI